MKLLNWFSRCLESSLRSLLTQAGMTQAQYNTGVVEASDSSAKIWIGVGYLPWSDHIGFLFNQENTSTWQVTHFSPAKARVIARMLTEAADRLENNGE